MLHRGDGPVARCADPRGDGPEGGGCAGRDQASPAASTRWRGSPMQEGQPRGADVLRPHHGLPRAMPPQKEPKMRLCLVEDHAAVDLEPLTLTRPTFDL